MVCLNGGLCETRHARSVCKCPDGFTGETCADRRLAFDLKR